MSKPAEAATHPDLRFQTLFEQAPFSVQLLGVDGRTLRVNKAWESLWQATEGNGLKAYVLGEYNILTDPQLAAKGIAEPLRRAFAGESVQLPLVAYDPAELGKPGRVRWVRAHAHPIRGQDGAVREVMLIHEDVTDQMQAEQALRASEERLKQLANSIPQLVWMADTEGSIHWYNDRWYDYTGTTPEDMVGWGWQSVHDPQVLPQVIERWKHSIHSGIPFSMTFPLRGRDGRFRPFFTLVAPLRDADGKVVQWFGTNTDVSALHEAEQGLRQAEERLRLAVDAGGIGIWDWDVVRNVVTWSDQVYRLHEMPPGSFGGRVEDFAARVHPDDRERVSNTIAAAVATQDNFSVEFRALLADGRVKWLSTWARVHRDPAGAAIRMVGATISIDAYKNAEAALRESDRRKDEFLAMLAHELRNPLAPISTAAALLQAAAGDEGRVRRASEIIARQVKHITKLVDDLLDASRVTRGLVDLDRQLLDLKLMIDHAVEQARPAIEARGHVLKTWSDADPAHVLGDGTRLVQAIVNLLNNAARYTPHRRNDHPGAARAGGPGAHQRQRQRRRHRSRPAAPRVRALHPGGAHAGPLARRPGHRAGAGQGNRRTPRRPGRRAEQGPGHGKHIHAQPAAGDARGAPAASQRGAFPARGRPAPEPAGGGRQPRCGPVAADAAAVGRSSRRRAARRTQRAGRAGRAPAALAAGVHPRHRPAGHGRLRTGRAAARAGRRGRLHRADRLRASAGPRTVEGGRLRLITSSSRSTSGCWPACWLQSASAASFLRRVRPFAVAVPGIIRQCHAGDQSLPSMSTFRLSRMNRLPTTSVMPATMIGYHRPLYMLPVLATIAKAVLGSRPPNHPLPMW